jgi:hypothetical protein
MTLHIFNPEHDIALASGKMYFTAPHAGRQLRNDLGWIPALWAAPNDYVLVNDVGHAEKSFLRLLAATKSQYVTDVSRCRFVTSPLLLSTDTTPYSADHMANLEFKIKPWGWDASLKTQLSRMGIADSLLPSDKDIDYIRRSSHRKKSAELLNFLHAQIDENAKDLSGYSNLIIGKAKECKTPHEVFELSDEWKYIVVKAPWSSSGRGIRFVKGDWSVTMKGWLKNTIATQGSVMVEPYYNKVMDFGMEFSSDGKGNVSYLGLSLFHTQNGAYTGNLLATESRKQQELSHYLSPSLLNRIQTIICQGISTIMEHYEGPFGVDMMIVSATKGQADIECTDRESHPFLLNPCVEINLRHTMGHVALSLNKLINPQNDDEIVKVMRIVYEDKQYKLKLQFI